MNQTARAPLPGGGNGFTLIEVLVVVAVMAVLATIAIPMTELSRKRNQEEDLRRALREIRTALDTHKKLADQGRIARPIDGSGFPASLEVLVDGIPDLQSKTGARIYILRQLPRDPMASAELQAAQTWSLRSYDSPSDSPRPGPDVFDVHSRADGVGLNGVPYSKW